MKKFDIETCIVTVVVTLTLVSLYIVLITNPSIRKREEAQAGALREYIYENYDGMTFDEIYDSGYDEGYSDGYDGGEYDGYRSGYVTGYDDGTMNVVPEYVIYTGPEYAKGF